MVVLKTVYDSVVTFDGSNSSNPDLVWYTQNFVDRYSPEFFNDYYGTTIPYNLTLYSSFGALRNGRLSICNLWIIFYARNCNCRLWKKS